MKTRGPLRRMKRGSSMGKALPSNVTSAATPSAPATVTLSVRSGSITSMRIGPTSRSHRSMFSTLEAWMQYSTPSRMAEKWASAMFRCG